MRQGTPQVGRCQAEHALGTRVGRMGVGRMHVGMLLEDMGLGGLAAGVLHHKWVRTHCLVVEVGGM